MRNVVLIVLLLMGCRGKQDKPMVNDSTASPGVEIDTVARASDDVAVQKIKVLVVQCSNGYEFATHGYDFNPAIEETLRDIEAFEVIPFPYKKLLGVTYQGVYDKKYCKPILEKVDVDFLIMTRFTGPHTDTPDADSIVWGYETKLLNAKTLNQKVSIGKHGFKEYRDIEIDIHEHTKQLVADIQNLK